MKLAFCALVTIGMMGCASTGGGGGGGNDSDLIRSLIDDAMAALKAADIDTMVENYADTFESDQGGGRDEMKEFLQGAQEQGFLEDIEIDLSNLVIAVDGMKASAKPIELEGAFGALTIEYDLEKIGGTWQVTYQTQY